MVGREGEGGAVVVEARGLRSAGGGGSRAKPEGRPRLRSARSLARARSLAYAAIGWPGVFPWIRRSRLDIDKWLTEGEPNTAPLLHMQGHPFVRAGVRRGRWTSADGERKSPTVRTPTTTSPPRSFPTTAASPKLTRDSLQSTARACRSPWDQNDRRTTIVWSRHRRR